MSPPLRLLRSSLPILGAIAALAALVWWVGPARLELASRRLGLEGVLWLLLIYTGAMAARTARFHFALPRERRPGIGGTGAITALHQLSNHLLPARLGEFAFPYLLHRATGHPAEAGLSLLLRVRLQEIGVLGALFTFALLTVQPGAGGGWRNWPALLGLGAVTTLLPVLLQRLLPPVLHCAAAGVQRLARGSRRPRLNRWGERLSTLCTRLAAENARRISWSQRAIELLLTIAVWLLIFLQFRESMRLTGHPVSYEAAIVGSGFANLAQLLPINTWGSIGSMEAGWTFGFSLVGVPAAEAMATAIIVHLLVIVFLGLFSLPAWLWFIRRTPGTPAPKA